MASALQIRRLHRLLGMNRLERAIYIARGIRKKLVAARPESLKNLAGDCGLASVMLAVRMNRPEYLRMSEDHAWNEINGTIVDITATQFDSKIRGVYVGTPLHFHGKLLASGLDAYNEIIEWGAYQNEPCWPKLSNHWSR